ncbi:hypothetical protein ACFQX6_22000 [Streptosporangium lutulentum]
MTTGALLATSLTGVTANTAQADRASTAAASPRIVPLPVSTSAAAESVNLALLPGAVASAKSQRMTRPDATYAPANAVDVFVHNGWTSNYASVGNGYDPAQDWFQVKLAEPAPVHEVFSRWTSRPSRRSTTCRSPRTPAVDVVNGRPRGESERQGFAGDRSQGPDLLRPDAGPGHEFHDRIHDQRVRGVVRPQPAPVVGHIIPVPVRQTPGTGQPWELTAESRVVVSGGGLAATAEILAGYLR